MSFSKRMSMPEAKGKFVFGVKDNSYWGCIRDRDYEGNNKEHECWALKTNGSDRLIRKDKGGETWFSVSASTPEEAKEFVKSKADAEAKAKADAEKKRFFRPTKSAATAFAAVSEPAATASEPTASEASN